MWTIGTATTKVKQIKFKRPNKEWNYSHYLCVLYLKICLAFFFFSIETRPHYIAHTGLKLVIFLCLPPKCWNYRHVSAHSLKAKCICKRTIYILRAYVVTEDVCRVGDAWCPLLLLLRLNVECSSFLTLEADALGTLYKHFCVFFDSISV